MYYIFLKNNKLNGCGECRRLDCENLEVSISMYLKYMESPNYFIFQDGEIIVNPNFEKEEEIKAKEAENEALKEELSNLDLKAVRPLRAILAGEGTDADRMRLVDLENEAQSIRAKITENNSVIERGGLDE